MINDSYEIVFAMVSLYSILLLFDYSSYTKYTLPEKSSNEEHIRYHKSTLLAG